MQLGEAVFSLLSLWQLLDFSGAQHLVHSFRGVVGAGNSTFYKLTREGTVRLVLESRLGSDTDLYVSDKTLHPNYTNYDLQSVTCGIDEVIIPKDFKRPVGIAVFGHPSVIDTSNYVLKVSIEDSPGEANGHSPTQGGSVNHHHSHSHTSSLPGPKDEEESIIWTLFVGILKIIFDILM